jgi:Uma2 family endonuclease
MSAVPEQYISLEEYFRLEETSEIKHEYYQGAVFAMTGASMAHNQIVAAVGGSLDHQLSNKSCQHFLSDFRLEIEAVGLYTYPDVSVVCGDVELANGRLDTFLNPIVLIEVLSESTEAYDRIEKAEFYRTIPSLREYLFIAQDRTHVERYQRQAYGWLFTEYSSLDEEVALDSIGGILSLAAIYKRVRFETAG